MPEEMQLQCYRLVQEALTNIQKHAGATEATVLLRNAGFGGDKARPGLLICVCDDGRGFVYPSGAETVPAENTAGHLGIRGMYERIAILGGALSFISERGEGTMVKIDAPLQ
jgi:signal transduction histidine kinase